MCNLRKKTDYKLGCNILFRMMGGQGRPTRHCVELVAGPTEELLLRNIGVDYLPVIDWQRDIHHRPTGMYHCNIIIIIVALVAVGPPHDTLENIQTDMTTIM